MNPKVVFGVVGGFVAVFSLSQIACAQQADPHGWLGTESLKTHFGDFQFKDGYPVGDTALAARGRGCGIHCKHRPRLETRLLWTARLVESPV
jgi:hypothetical protein